MQNLWNHKRGLDVKKLNTIQEGQHHRKQTSMNASTAGKNSFTAPNSKAKFVKTAQSWARSGTAQENSSNNGAVISDFRGLRVD